MKTIFLRQSQALARRAHLKVYVPFFSVTHRPGYHIWQNPLLNKKKVATISELSAYKGCYREFDVAGFVTGFVFLDPFTGDPTAYSNLCPQGHELSEGGGFFDRNREWILCRNCGWKFDFDTGTGHEGERMMGDELALRPLVLEVEEDEIFFMLDQQTKDHPGQSKMGDGTWESGGKATTF